MDSIETPLVELIMTLTAANGDKLELVDYVGSGCGLLCNGVPIPKMKWVPCRMDRCTAELLRLGNVSSC